MLIGELAERAGVSTRMLRYYDEQGLLASRRSANGYRTYDDVDLRAVREIRTLMDNGFSLEETRPFVECLRAGFVASDVCPASIGAYRRKLAELDAGIERLRRTRDDLAARLAVVGDLDASAPICQTSVGVAR